MPETIDAAIGQIEGAEALDVPGHLLGRAISRTGQTVGKPGKGLADAVHGRGYGHPVHPLVVAHPISWRSRPGSCTTPAPRSGPCSGRPSA